MSLAANPRAMYLAGVSALLLMACVCGAQTSQPGSASSSGQAQTSTQTSRSATANEHRNQRSLEKKSKPSAGSIAATPPSVTLKDGKLTITANHSDLGQILKDVADVSGMTLDGPGGSTPVSGVYGPGNPREVLSDLLAESRCNFLMVGSISDGVPRELLLAGRKENSLPAPVATPASSSQEDNDPGSPQADQEPPGPGAIVHVPPAPSEDTDTRVQQNLQRLQQMHDQQEQQQQQNPPQ